MRPARLTAQSAPTTVSISTGPGRSMSASIAARERATPSAAGRAAWLLAAHPTDVARTATVSTPMRGEAAFQRPRVTTPLAGTRCGVRDHSSNAGENNFAFHRPHRQELDRLSRGEQREGDADQGVNLFLADQREDLHQILAQGARILSIQQGDTVERAPPAAQARPDEEIQEHGQGCEGSPDPHESVSHHRPAPARGADAQPDVGAADRIEDMIDAVGLEGAGEDI